MGFYIYLLAVAVVLVNVSEGRVRTFSYYNLTGGDDCVVLEISYNFYKIFRKPATENATAQGNCELKTTSLVPKTYRIYVEYYRLEEDSTLSISDPISINSYNQKSLPGGVMLLVQPFVIRFNAFNGTNSTFSFRILRESLICNTDLYVGSSLIPLVITNLGGPLLSSRAGTYCNCRLHTDRGFQIKLFIKELLLGHGGALYMNNLGDEISEKDPRIESLQNDYNITEMQSKKNTFSIYFFSGMESESRFLIYAYIA